MSFGFFDHEMDIEGKVRGAPGCLHDEWSHCDVGYEMSIHYIDMDPIDAGIFTLANLVAQTGKSADRIDTEMIFFIED